MFIDIKFEIQKDNQHDPSRVKSKEKEKNVVNTSNASNSQTNIATNSKSAYAKAVPVKAVQAPTQTIIQSSQSKSTTKKPFELLRGPGRY